MNPRKPTTEEKRELVEYVAKQEYEHPTEADIAEAKEEAEGWLENAAVAVYDHYITDSPGYAGKVMVVVWPAAQSLTETYIWRGGHITQVPIDTQKWQFDDEELEAIEEYFNDAVKEHPENKLYQSIHRKAVDLLAYGEEAA